MADPQQSRRSGYREVVIISVTTRNLADARVGPSRISKWQNKNVQQVWYFDLYFFAGRAVGAATASGFDGVGTRNLGRGEGYFNLTVNIRRASRPAESTFGAGGIVVVMTARVRGDIDCEADGHTRFEVRSVSDFGGEGNRGRGTSAGGASFGGACEGNSDNRGGASASGRGIGLNTLEYGCDNMPAAIALPLVVS